MRIGLLKEQHQCLFIASILLWGLWCLWSSLSGFPDRSETRETFPRTETIRSHSSRAGKPSNLSPVSNEIDDFRFCLNCEKQQFVSCTSNLLETNVWLPKTHNVPPEVDFESSRSPAKSESWNSPQSALFGSITHMDKIVCIHMYDEYMKSIDSIVCHMLWSIWWWIVWAYLPDHRNIKSSNSCQILTFQNNLRACIWQFSNRFHFFFYEVVVIDAWCRYFVSVVESSYSPTHTIVPHTSLHDQPCHKTMKKYEDFEGMVISLLLLRRNSRFEHGSVIVHNIFAYFTLSLSAAQAYMIKERCWFSQIDFFVEYFPHRIKILFLSSQFYVIHIHR